MCQSAVSAFPLIAVTRAIRQSASIICVPDIPAVEDVIDAGQATCPSREAAAGHAYTGCFRNSAC